MDLILAFDVVEHFTKREILDLLAWCYRAIKSGGHLVLQLPNAASPFSGPIQFGDFSHETAMSPRALAQILRLTGFVEMQPREVSVVPRPLRLKSAARFLAWRAIRLIVSAIAQAEPGPGGDSVYSRVFLMSARKPPL